MQAAGKNQTPAWPSTPPNPISPVGALPAGTPHQQDTGPAGVLPLPLSLLAQAVQARLGGSQMSLLACGWLFLTLEQNTGWGNPGSLAHCLPRMVCLTLVRPSSWQPTGRERRLILAGNPSEHGPEHGCCGPGPASWVDVGRKGTCQGGRLSEGCHQPPGLIFLTAWTWG